MEIDTLHSHLVAESVRGVNSDVADAFGHLWLNDAAGHHLSIIEDVTGRLWWRSMDGPLMEWQPGDAEAAFICDPTATTIDQAEGAVPDALLAQIIDQVAAEATTAGEYERPTGWFLIPTNAAGEQFRFGQWGDGSLIGQSPDGTAIA